MLQSHAESMMGALQDLPANQHSHYSPIPQIMTEMAVLVSWQILKGSQAFLHTFSIALYHKLDVKNGFAYGLQFFSLISDSLGGVANDLLPTLYVLQMQLGCKVFQEIVLPLNGRSVLSFRRPPTFSKAEAKRKQNKIPELSK